MTSAQKTTFLESYACLILLNYTRISTLDPLLYKKAVDLQVDKDPAVKTNAILIVRMV
jgi:hypothetical protein